jgi:hypothetical protein
MEMILNGLPLLSPGVFYFQPTTWIPIQVPGDGADEMVLFRILEVSLHPSRIRIGGGELRLGTRSMCMGTP